MISVFRQALSIHRFPAFCACLVGGSTLFPIPIKSLLRGISRLIGSSSDPLRFKAAGLFSNFIASLFAASFAFRLLNSGPKRLPVSGRGTSPPNLLSHLDVVKLGPFDDPPEIVSPKVNDATPDIGSLPRPQLAGKTMDLTLFAVIRALDIVICGAWNRASLKATSRLRKLSQTTPTVLFCFSAATIMHAWFYSPSRLPLTYNTWISAAAELDRRLLLALRHARYGTWIYGRETGFGNLLGSMCHDYGLPEELGDPAKTIPVPCEIVHMGCGKSCEKHALVRFWRGWSFAAKMYGPLELFVLARHVKKAARPGNRLAGLRQHVLLSAIVDMTRSSAFLGAFIAFFYYGVCLSRTRLGPRLFSYKTVTPQMWDSGLCVLGGCLLCGTSILVEQPRKRLEVLFFVLPRAAATWFPRRYLPDNQWKEHLAFAISAAVVITTGQENPKQVRGVFGNILQAVLKTD